MLANATYPGSELRWNGGVFPAGAGISTAVIPCNLMAVDPSLKNAYVASWNFGIRHGFANNLSLEVGYAGNVSERRIFFRDINQLNPARPSVRRQLPYLQFINQASTALIPTTTACR